ncbi:hypothetical protein EB235_04535 [Mesorhizobium loti R88b]|uniref:Uncharacterized protein n=1 Tax=Mesorhizobium loti R88b TaxID=935548 RepID=A0A6M7WM30_RHILI|nr:hypothetical protein EB235_04535 [Mesorhizobium loti R88b]
MEWVLRAGEGVEADFVILGRSKERSDAAQTLGSMPGRQGKQGGPEPSDLPAVVTAEICTVAAL